MAGQVWEYVKKQLPKLRCTEASTLFWNGGDSVSSFLAFANRAGLHENVRLAALGSGSGLVCEDGIAQFHVSTGRGHGRGCRIEVRTSLRDKSGDAHLRTIGQLFGGSVPGLVEKSICAHHIKKAAQKLRAAQGLLRRAKEV